ncbi:hypothetical protein WA1_23095 [Scytonema hofmannii PCC 7110]|uniref:Uncharacterized protein n=1 Tax=Scytonema hofmannii PCC 7110 TaxID=128403 RepID=A0A139X8L1_9CYAN|nr:DUF349 domain-containing protein [Scytonema hofmannii]KYC41016.1 hypothetical protein WA1_23095 [Scytonema hofmannii PCC 7110]
MSYANSLFCPKSKQYAQPTPNQNALDYWEQLKETLQPTFDTINSQLTEHQRLLKEKAALAKTAHASERERQKLLERLQNLELTLDLWKAQANRVRDLPLEDVAYHLGLHQDNKAQHKWKGSERIISIIGTRFYDFTGNQKGGGGATDLVMHVLGCGFQEAVLWLQDQFGESVICIGNKV